MDKVIATSIFTIIGILCFSLYAMHLLKKKEVKAAIFVIIFAISFLTAFNLTLYVNMLHIMVFYMIFSFITLIGCEKNWKIYKVKGIRVILHVGALSVFTPFVVLFLLH